MCLIVVLIYVTGIITDIIVSAICDHFCKLKSITNICRIADNYFNLKEKIMIEKGMPVTISIVDAKKVHVLGTPEELQTFLHEN